MQTPELPACRDCWYVAAPSSRIAKGAIEPFTILSERVIIGRDNGGDVFALRDFCPHRGMPLSYGQFDGRELQCCYHGWCFTTDGTCTKIPSLTTDDKTLIGKIKAKSYPAREADGLIWIYMARDGQVSGELPEPPSLPAHISGGLHHVDSVIFPCDLDHAVIGLMDPSHGPFVHKSWWWRSEHSIHEKQKDFAPVDHGFTMLSHKPSSNSRAYRILGGQRRTEISFRLPGLRTEHITIGKQHIVLLTALTPIDEHTTMLHQFMGTTIGALNLLRPLIAPFGKAFIRQDLEVVKKQQEGLRGQHPPLMLLGDADAQAIWYYRLKKEYHAAQAENRPFANPLKARTLRWRS